MQKSPRSLKAVSVGNELAFTLRGIKAVTAPSLCDHCACNQAFEKFERCWVDKHSIDNLSKVGVAQEVTHCVMHQPIISFQAPLLGFEAEFNTIRPGGAWFSRLHEGVIIGLLDVKQDALFGKAQVTSIDKGDILYMLEKHAHKNHLMLSHTADQASKLMSVLSRIYGPRIINDQSIVSVISLKRL